MNEIRAIINDMTKHDQDATNQIMASLDQAGNMEIDIDNCKSPPGELADTEKPAEEGEEKEEEKGAPEAYEDFKIPEDSHHIVNL